MDYGVRNRIIKFGYKVHALLDATHQWTSWNGIYINTFISDNYEDGGDQVFLMKRGTSVDPLVRAADSQTTITESDSGREGVEVEVMLYVHPGPNFDFHTPPELWEKGEKKHPSFITFPLAACS